MVDVIPYRRRYDNQILELNKKLVHKWYTIAGPKPKSTSWDNLTPHERFLHGGPWNDPQTLDIHLKGMNIIGDLALLVDNSDNLVGMMEYHPFKETLHLDWMMIDPKYQRKNLGSMLLDFLGEKLRQPQYQEIWTEPDEGVEKFYLKNAYKQITPSIYRYSFESNQLTQNTEWDDYDISRNDLTKIKGEANNDIIYLQFLLETGIKYAELFDHPYPLYKQYIDDKVVIYRDIAGFPERSSLMLIHDEEKIHLEEIEDYLRPYRRSFFTNLGTLDTSWDFVRDIKRLKRASLL